MYTKSWKEVVNKNTQEIEQTGLHTWYLCSLN